MRISVEKGDSGYTKDVRGVLVFVDGVEVKNCLTADEELDFVVVLLTASDGQPVIAGDRFQTEVKRGRVAIVMPNIDFDVWMRGRRDVAHSRYMARIKLLRYRSMADAPVPMAVPCAC
jgi:hypothetical protein